ncbi:hypothetical protein [Moritella sp.]|uniref:hypothetical protein n=1 Tax=Moritella sp. TaxID=78556 RepID=UPI001D492D88|nr:hypothetical protein [Moritella sp.]MCJ8348042.1 hypothetical protein [Moritella sp.]NQZ42633.1 hypothetical protein [Moritella sp.]
MKICVRGNSTKPLADVFVGEGAETVSIFSVSQVFANTCGFSAVINTFALCNDDGSVRCFLDVEFKKGKQLIAQFKNCGVFRDGYPSELEVGINA